MRKKVIFLLSLVLLAGLVNRASTAIIISGTEIWDGGQMHGVTPTGSGTAEDPYVYVIGSSMSLTSSGVIKMNDKYVTFDFNSSTGGLDMAAGSYLDLTGSGRLSDPGECTIILGDNNLTGAGDFKTVDINKDSMDVSITGSGSVTVNSFYMRTNDALAGSVEIDVGGSASVDSIDTQDQAVGGNNGGDVIIQAGDVTVGNIDTRALRINSGDRLSGSVLIEARDFAGTNTPNNAINLYGTINTDSTIGIDGDITNSGVVVTLESGFDAVTGDGLLSIYAGMVQYGKTANELFTDNSGGGYTAEHIVPWTGPRAEFYALESEPGYLAGNVNPNVALSWSPGVCAAGHDVYLGTDFNDVNNAADPNVPPGRGRQDSNSYDPPGFLEFGRTYYWRIDEVNCTDANSLWRGAIWIFTVDDGKAENIDPRDGASCVPLSVNLVWTPGVLATSHDVYFGTDFNDVNDANSAWPMNISVYKGRQEANDYDPVVLALDTTYYWRIDGVGSGTLVKGDVWNFRTAMINVIDHVIVYYEGGKFAGWPANNGLLWNWGDDEVVVGFAQADFECKSGHNNTGPSYNVLARSTDSGMTWTTFDPEDFVGDGGSSGPSPGVNFAHPNFAMRVDEEEYYISYDRCQSWEGPYDMGTFGESTVDSWENTSRTDYVANGSDDCLVFMSVKPVGGSFGTDRAFCIRTTDGGVTFQFQGWIVPPSDPYRGVMPSTVRCSPTKLVSALRRRNMDESCDAWVDVYASNNNGVTWSFLSQVGETGCENGNPPALARLSDGRLSCVYGNRSDMRMYMKYSDDEGASWGEQITLRDDWADCADDHQDLGYPRIAQLANGTIIAAYYWSTPDHIENHIAATIWDTREPPCVVDFRHFARFADYWLETGSDLPADLYEDDIVNWLDLEVFVDEWLDYCPYDWPLR